MGTNYYLHRDVCPHCGVSKTARLHIGKSSAGWCFSLRVYEHDDWDFDPPLSLPKNLDDWMKLWSLPQHKIRDEYGADVTPEEMLEVVTDRRCGEPVRTLGSGPAPYGYGSWPEFFSKNEAVPGPHGLLRHRVLDPEDPRLRSRTRCVAHGDGTYDLLVGEFC